MASFAPMAGALSWPLRNPIRTRSPASSRRELSGRSSGRRSLPGCGLIPRSGGEEHPARYPWDLRAPAEIGGPEAPLKERRDSHTRDLMAVTGGPNPWAVRRCDRRRASLVREACPVIESPWGEARPAVSSTRFYPDGRRSRSDQHHCLSALRIKSSSLDVGETIGANRPGRAVAHGHCR